MTKPCGVPGCLAPREEHDCCDEHSRPDYGNSPVFSPNDGIIDEVAIDVVARGIRQVPLTWVEAEIAAGTMLARGLTITETMERLGSEFKSTGRRREEIERIRNVLLRGEVAV